MFPVHGVSEPSAYGVATAPEDIVFFYFVGTVKEMPEITYNMFTLYSFNFFLLSIVSL